MNRHPIPDWATYVTDARTKAKRNPQLFAPEGAYAGETYATIALDHAAAAGYADTEYGSVYQLGYEVAVFRLTAADAQTLGYRNRNELLLSRFVLIRDDQGRAQTYGYETDQDLDNFVSDLENDIAAFEARCEQQDPIGQRPRTGETAEQTRLL